MFIQLCERLNVSIKATERLVAIVTCKGLPNQLNILSCQVAKWLIEVEDKLKGVLEEQIWDDLAASEWQTLTHVINPLQQFTGNKFTTLLCAISAITFI